jgi:hypothetical protein
LIRRLESSLQPKQGCPKVGLGQGQEVSEPPAITPGKSQRLQWFGVAGHRGHAGAEVPPQHPHLTSRILTQGGFGRHQQQRRLALPLQQGE